MSQSPFKELQSKPSSQQNYRQLYEQAKHTINLQEGKIIKLQEEIRQRCQSYLLHSGIKSSQGLANGLGSSGLRKVPLQMSGGSNPSKRSHQIKLQKKVVDQTLVALFGINNNNFDHTPTNTQNDQKSQQSNSMQNPMSVINISTNFDSESEAITALKERMIKMRGEKNETYKQLTLKKQENKKLKDQIVKVKNLLLEQERSSKKSIELLGAKADKFQKAFMIIQDQINKDADEEHIDGQSNNPIQKVTNYINKIKSYYGNSQSLLTFLDNIQNLSSGLKEQNQIQPKEALLSAQEREDNLNPNHKDNDINSPKDEIGDPEERSNPFQQFRTNQRQEDNSDIRLNQRPSLAKNISLQVVKHDSVNFQQEEVAQQRKIYQKQLTQLKKELSVLQDYTNTLKHDLQKLTEENTTLKHTIQDYDHQVAQLKQQGKDKIELQQTCHKLNDEIRNLKVELENTQRRKEQIIAQLQIQAKKSTQEKLSDQNAEQRNSGQQNNNNKTSEMQQSKYNEQLKLLRQSQKRLQIKDQKLQSEILDLKGQIKNLEQSQVNLKGQIGSLEQSQINLKGQIRSLQQSQVNLKGQIGSLEQSQINLKGQIRSLQQSQTNLKRQIFDFQEKIKSLNDAQLDLQNSNHNTTLETGRSNGEVSEISPSFVKANKSLEENLQYTNYERILSQNSQMEKEIKELRERLANQQSSQTPNPAAYNPDFQPYMIEEDIVDYMNGQYNDQYVKRRFVRRKVIRRNISAMTFRSVSRSRKEIIEDLHSKLKKLKQGGMETGKSISNQSFDYEQAKMKKYVSRIAKLEKLLKSQQDRISQMSKQSSQVVSNSRQSDSSMDQQQRVDLIQLTTEMPGKSMYAGKIFETKKPPKSNEIVSQRHNRFNFAKKGKTQSSGVL